MEGRKQKMKDGKTGRKFRRVLHITCLAFMLLMLFPGIHTQAATNRAKALKAYSKLLSQNQLQWNDSKSVQTAKCKFALIYVDKNNVPELFVDASGAGGLGHVDGFYRMYTYVKGKVVEVCTVRDGFSYYKKKGIFSTYTAMQGEYITYQKLSNGKSKIQLTSRTYMDTKYYNAAEKEITKKAFKRGLKKYVGSTKPSAPKCYANTAANRKKHLK